MPSPSSPTVVDPGPGKLAAGQVPASSLAFSFSGAGDLEAHINDPVDAHMSGAIGVPEINPTTLQPLLSSAGGPYDGESVLDALTALADLLPIRPDLMGFDAPTIPNSGIPNWTALDTITTGGFSRGGNICFTHHLVPTATVGPVYHGMVYPADRGVLALYSSTTGDYANPAITALLGALWLGSNPAPVGIPSSAFDETLRAVQQLDHPPGGGVDIFTYNARVPQLSSYAGYAVPWAVFPSNFIRYQLAQYAGSLSLAAGDNGGFLLVHWKETYAVTLASIQPAQIAANFNTTNCYSASSPDADTVPEFYVNRHNVFRDTTSATPPSGNTFTTGVVGVPTAVYLSGVEFYDNGVSPLLWSFDVRANNLFSDSFYTGTVPNANIPPGMESAYDPMVLDFSDFGGSNLLLHYYDLKAVGPGLNYDPTNSPLPADVGQFISFAHDIPAPTTMASPIGGYGVLRVNIRKPFSAQVVYADASSRYLFNSYPQTGGSTASTETMEPFTDEKYRYINSVVLVAPNKPVIPLGGDVYDSTVALASADGNLESVGSQLVYPQVNFSAGYTPVGPDYAAVLAGDAPNDLRRYVRAFNTGVARNIGKLRIQGLDLADFNSAGAYTGSEVNDHTGGAIIQIKLPGPTGWLDLGRVKGDPDLDVSQDYRGCRTGYSVVGSDLIVTYDTTAYTGDNGSGDFLVFVRVTFIKNGTGQGLVLDELEWQAP
jgi:hypothetical protein